MQKNGRRSDAQSLSYGFLPESGKPAIMFVSSGTLLLVPAEDVERIEFDYSPGNVDYCGECDQQIGQLRRA